MCEDTAVPADSELQDLLDDDTDEHFGAATEHVAAVAGSGRLGSKALLSLYGLYKQGTEGPCTAARPSFFYQTALSKWCASAAEHLILNLSAKSCTLRLSQDRETPDDLQARHRTCVAQGQLAHEYGLVSSNSTERYA